MIITSSRQGIKKLSFPITATTSTLTSLHSNSLTHTSTYRYLPLRSTIYTSSILHQQINGTVSGSSATPTPADPNKTTVHKSGAIKTKTTKIDEKDVDKITGTGSPNFLIGLASKVGGVNSEEDHERVARAMRIVYQDEHQYRKHSQDKPTTAQEISGSDQPLYRSSVEYPEDYDHSETAQPHPIWSGEYVNKVVQSHKLPENFTDKLASLTIRIMRFNFDWMSGWSFGKVTEEKALRRICFLETVAGVPGSVAGIIRHLASLRRLKRDHGWIHTLFEEAENERMHLMVYMTLKKPTPSFRGAVWLTQGVFFNFFFLAYLVHPRFCHSMVGYLEESAVATYTHVLHEIDSEDGGLREWKTQPAPQIAIDYWKLPENAKMRDVILVTRADEAHHRDVNHAFASLKPTEPNPFPPGQ